jgi:hypothetical protein
MADNTRLNQETTSGDLIASDEISGGVADGSKAQRVKQGFGSDGSYTDVSSDDPLPVDAGEIDDVSGALIAINHSHHKMHEGKHFFYKSWMDLDGAGSVGYFMFRTPDTAVRMHSMTRVTAEAEFTVEIFEGGTVSADGAQVTPFNNDRDSAAVPGISAFAGPTVTDDGLLIWAAKVGSTRDATLAPPSAYEIIAKRNSLYLIKLTKEASQIHWVDVDFWWYEHTPVV